MDDCLSLLFQTLPEPFMLGECNSSPGTETLRFTFLLSFELISRVETRLEHRHIIIFQLNKIITHRKPSGRKRWNLDSKT